MQVSWLNSCCQSRHKTCIQSCLLP